MNGKLFFIKERKQKYRLENGIKYCVEYCELRCRVFIYCGGCDKDNLASYKVL